IVRAVAVDDSGNIYVAGTEDETFEEKILKITPDGVVTTLAVSDTMFSSDITVDGSGNIYVADSMNNKIWKITPDGEVTTLAGSGTVFDINADGELVVVSGQGSVDGSGVDSRFNEPTGIGVDGSGNIYVADTGNHKIRKIIAGSATVSANLGDSFTFEVVASGDAPIIYEWYHDGAVVGEATGSSLILSELEVTDSGDYHVVVSNEIMAKSGDMVQFGIETSDTVTLEVLLPPEITQIASSMEGGPNQLSATAEVTGDEEEPTIYTWSEDGVLLQGDNVELTVTVTGTEPITYEWYHGEELVEGGTESTLRLTDVQGVDSGD
ncbi:uncharacterized protein METZ01_LOCUS348581, partial [marine metagenome]